MTIVLSSTLYPGPLLFPLLHLPCWDISNFPHLLYVAVPSRCLGSIFFSKLFCCIWTYCFFLLHHYQRCHYSKAKLMIYSWLWFIAFWTFYRAECFLRLVLEQLYLPVYPLGELAASEQHFFKMAGGDCPEQLLEQLLESLTTVGEREAGRGRRLRSLRASIRFLLVTHGSLN